MKPQSGKVTVDRDGRRYLITSSGALRAWWSLVALVLACILAVGVSTVYTVYYVHKLDQRWCRLLTTLDEPGGPPPTTERGLRVQQQIHELRRQLGCT